MFVPTKRLGSFDSPIKNWHRSRDAPYREYWQNQLLLPTKIQQQPSCIYLLLTTFLADFNFYVAVPAPWAASSSSPSSSYNVLQQRVGLIDYYFWNTAEYLNMNIVVGRVIWNVRIGTQVVSATTLANINLTRAHL